MIWYVVLGILILLALVAMSRLRGPSNRTDDDAVRLEDPTGRIHRPYGDSEKPPDQ